MATVKFLRACVTHPECAGASVGIVVVAIISLVVSFSECGHIWICPDFRSRSHFLGIGC